MEDKLKLDSSLVTLGTDIKKRFAWCLREVNGTKCVCLHNRIDGLSNFNEDDFITAIPLKGILEIANSRNIKTMDYKITKDELTYVKETVSMFSSMILCGENHSSESRERLSKVARILTSL